MLAWLQSWFPDIEEDDPLEDDGELELHEHVPRVVTREEWGAAEPRSQEEFASFPVPYIVAMHTGTRPCFNKADCKLAVKEIQQQHMAAGEPDILYNYLLDSRGNIYVGRGPSTVSMLYPEELKKLSKANKKSIAVGILSNGALEPSKKLFHGGGSLTTLLFDGKYIDETAQFLWHNVPVKGLPVEEEEEKPDVVMEHVEEQTRRLVEVAARPYDEEDYDIDARGIVDKVE